MTTYATYTPVGVPRGNFNERKLLAAAALSPGDFYALADGLIGFYAGLEAAAINDLVTYYMTGQFDVKCAATTDTYVDGAAVYFDTVNKYATTTGSATCLYMGTAIGAKVTGTSTVRVALNGQIAPSLSGAATATTITVSSTATLSGNTSVGGTLAVTGATTLTGTLKVAANNTPVAATGTDQAGAAAVGAQDIVTISSDGAAKGVKLRAGVAGQRITIINTTATACKLYPATGGTIDGLSANAAVTIAASKRYVLVCTAADTWFSIESAAATAA